MLQHPPLVSMVVVTYNQAKYLPQTLKSLIDQDYDNFEIIIADDASTDGTQEVILDFAKSHPEVIRPLLHSQNLGVTGNCNSALKLCRGEFIAFAGGDDLYEPNKISAQVQWFLENPDGVLCGHDVMLFKEDPAQPMHLYSRIYALRSGYGAEDFLQHGAILAAISIMVRAQAIPPYGFDKRLPIASDIKFSVDCLLSGGKYGYAPGILGFYRRLGTGLSFIREVQCTKDLLKMFDIVAQQRPDLQAAMQVSQVRANIYLGIQLAKAGQYKDSIAQLVKITFRSPLKSAHILYSGIVKKIQSKLA